VATADPQVWAQPRLRSRRGRNADWAERAVRRAASLPSPNPAAMTSAIADRLMMLIFTGPPKRDFGPNH
jgi:hypothetical protein